MRMEEAPNDVMVLSAIYQGSKKLDKVRKKTGLPEEDLSQALDRLEKNEMVQMVERRGFFGPKKELVLTDKGMKELEERKFELQQNWDNIVNLWKGGNKEQLQQQLDSNRPMFPAMMFMGIMDMMMFSSMMSFMGLAMTSFLPDASMYDTGDMGHDGGQDTGHDGGHDMGHDSSGGDLGHADFGHDMGGFDVNF